MPKLPLLESRKYKMRRQRDDRYKIIYKSDGQWHALNLSYEQAVETIQGYIKAGV